MIVTTTTTTLSREDTRGGQGGQLTPTKFLPDKGKSEVMPTLLRPHEKFPIVLPALSPTSSFTWGNMSRGCADYVTTTRRQVDYQVETKNNKNIQN